MTRPTSPEQVFRTEVFITFKTPPRSPSSKSLPQNSTSSKATAVTQTESDDLDLFPSDESSDESLASIQSHNRYFEDSYIGDAHPEDLYPEQQLTSDLDSGVSEVTNAIELPGSSPLNDTTEQDLLDVYNTFSPSAASEPLPATESFQDKLPSMLDKSPSCPSLLTGLLSTDGHQNQGVPSNDDSPLPSNDGRLNCLSPSAMVFAMSNDVLTQPSSALAMSPDQHEGTYDDIQEQDTALSPHSQSLADLLCESPARNTTNPSTTSAVQRLLLFQNHQNCQSSENGLGSTSRDGGIPPDKSSPKSSPEIGVTVPPDLGLSSLFEPVELDFPSSWSETSSTATPRANTTSSSLFLRQLFDESEDLDDGDYDTFSALGTSISCPDLYTTELPSLLLRADLLLGTASSPHLVPSSCVHTHSRLLPSIQSLLTRMVTRLRRKFRGHPGRPP